MYFDNERMIVVFNGKVILRGTRSSTKTNKLWCIDTPTSQPFTQPAQMLRICSSYISIQNTPAFVPVAKLKITSYATIADTVAFLHGALGNSALSTLCKALNAGFLSSWSEITSKLIRKYPRAPQQLYKGTLTKRDAMPGQRKQRPS